MKYKVEITRKQFEVLEDVLSEIEEFRGYEDDDGIALEELQEIFSWEKYKEFAKLCEESKKRYKITLIKAIKLPFALIKFLIKYFS